MPLNRGGYGQWQGRRGHGPGQHTFSSWSRNPELIFLHNQKKKTKKKTRQLSFYVLAQCHSLKQFSRAKQFKGVTGFRFYTAWMYVNQQSSRLWQCCIYRCKNNCLVFLKIQEVFSSSSSRSCEHDSSAQMSSSSPNFSQRSGHP